MNGRIRAVWDGLRESYWFVPAVLVAAAVVLSVVTVNLDRGVEWPWIDDVGWLSEIGPDGAREMLSSIAGSMLTVAGVTLSLTMLVLSQASSQYGPRLLGNFLRDTGNQVVLGTFTATFVYSLLVLRTVRSGEVEPFVPTISVGVAVLLAVLNVGVLVYFINHVPARIHVSNVVADAGQRLLHTVAQLYPERLGHEAADADHQEPPAAAPPQRGSRSVSASKPGYVRAIGADQVLEVASRYDLVVELVVEPGDFALPGATLVRVWPAEAATDAVVDSLRSAVNVAARRTPTQDAEFAVRQLMETAIRALSPSMNDPFTAVSCLDWLSAGLSEMAGRAIPSGQRYGKDHALRVIARPVSFPRLLEIGLDPIRQYGAEHVAVVMHLCTVITRIAGAVRRPEDHEALRRQATLLATAAEQALPVWDYDRLRGRISATLAALSGSSPVDGAPGVRSGSVRGD